MTEEGHSNIVPIPVNGNGRTLKTVWVVLGFIVTTITATLGGSQYLSNNFVAKDIYESEKASLSTNIQDLSIAVKHLTESINTLNTKIAVLEVRGK